MASNCQAYKNYQTVFCTTYDLSSEESKAIRYFCVRKIPNLYFLGEITPVSIVCEVKLSHIW